MSRTTVSSSRMLTTLCAGVAMLAFGAPAQAAGVLVDFEDIAVAAGTNDVGGDRISRGFTFDSSSDHTHLVNNTPLFNAWNGTTNLQIDDFIGRNRLTVTKATGGLFSLLSVDLGEGASDTGNASLVRITGHLFGGGTVTRDVRMDGVFDQAGPLADFQNEAFDAGWSNLTSIDFEGVAGVGALNYLIDNLGTGDSIAVPLPGTLLLAGLGLALMPLARRR